MSTTFSMNHLIWSVSCTGPTLVLSAVHGASNRSWRYTAEGTVPVSTGRDLPVATVVKMLTEKASPFFKVDFPSPPINAEHTKLNVEFTLAGPLGLTDSVSCDHFSVALRQEDSKASQSNSELIQLRHEVVQLRHEVVELKQKLPKLQRFVSVPESSLPCTLKGCKSTCPYYEKRRTDVFLSLENCSPIPHRDESVPSSLGGAYSWGYEVVCNQVYINIYLSWHDVDRRRYYPSYFLELPATFVSHIISPFKIIDYEENLVEPYKVKSKKHASCSTKLDSEKAIVCFFLPEYCLKDYTPVDENVNRFHVHLQGVFLFDDSYEEDFR
mmetsp:Transcript_26759/g.67238  ORF Transcript_26759/g.67238 Transcript_26759/m.67238 type:complete len:326 (-) Transcript_26759:1842-2819(-)